MTNQVVAFQTANLPAALQQRLAQFNAGNVLASLGGAGEQDKISIKGSRFRIKQVGIDEVVLQQLHMDGIIIFANPYTSRAYYKNTYDPNAEDQSPDCASSNGHGPDNGVKNPQSTACATCPQAVWGSKISPRGAKIKACGDSQRIAFLPIDPSTNNFFMVDGKPKAFAMSIPAASMKALGSYAKTLAQRGLPLEIALTRLTFDAAAEFPKLEFAFNSVLPEQAAVYILDFVDANKEHLNELVDGNIKASQNVQVQAQVQPSVAAPVQQPIAQAPAVVQEMPSFNPAPTVQASAPVFQAARVVQPAPQPMAQPNFQPAPQAAQPAPTIAAAPASLLNALQGAMGL